MSVLMTLRASADVKRLEDFAAENPEKMRSIVERAQQAGVIAHRFYGTEGGQIMVVDEWESEEGFQAFFQEAGALIRPMMQAAGVTSEPEIKFWRKLSTGDDV